MKCINCGNPNGVVRVEDAFTCRVCKYGWTVQDEQANAAYIRAALSREPATSVFVPEAEEGEAEPSPVPSTPSGLDATRAALAEMDIDALLEYAREAGVAVPENGEKDAVVEAIVQAALGQLAIETASSPSGLAAMTVAQLRELARERNLEVPARITKSELIALLEANDAGVS